ncbi:MAG: PEP-CTERM sorting domain-containing protein [Candidatus Caldarchaeum sp.]
MVGGTWHASLWSSSAASWVSLHPAGASTSAAYAAWGTNQVGHARVGGLPHASLWSGTAASWVDLHTFLPSIFDVSFATGMSDDGINFYITGFGYNSTMARWEALHWTTPVPEPGTVSVLALSIGTLVLRCRKSRR